MSAVEHRAYFEHALKAAQGVPLEMIVTEESSALTRFANNAIHQNVAERVRHISVRAVVNGRTARATTNRADPDSIRSAVEDALALAAASEPDPNLPDLTAHEPARELSRFDEAVAACTAEERAREVAAAIRVVQEAGQTAAGIYSTGAFGESIFNSLGFHASHTETMVHFSITAMGEDSSGWAKASGTSRGNLDPLALARSAARKASLSARPKEIAPGRYTVILEPAAVLDVVGQMIPDFSATALAEQRSFLTGRLGEKLFGANITIRDDALHPLQAGAAFDGEGMPRQPLTLVEAGVPRAVAVSRTSAKRDGIAATGHGLPLPSEMLECPVNVVIEGGGATLEGMIASAERAILVTRLWYIREVDPYEKIMTGMTRDGTFLVEDGRIVCGLRNFRFNQSLIETLNNVEALSAPVRASGEEIFDMVVPAMQVRDFNFTEVTRF
jgi:predicted Zn-dependent protease